MSVSLFTFCRSEFAASGNNKFGISLLPCAYNFKRSASLYDITNLRIICESFDIAFKVKNLSIIAKKGDFSLVIINI